MRIPNIKLLIEYSSVKYVRNNLGQQKIKKQHLHEVHTANILQVCEVCEKIFNKVKTRDDHQEICGKNMTKYKCYVCDNEFKTEHTRDTHIQKTKCIDEIGKLLNKLIKIKLILFFI